MHTKRDVDEMVKKLGGRFKLTVLIQKRIQELARGASPLVAAEPGTSLIDTAMSEILGGKVQFEGLDEDGKGRKSKKEKE
jgi:DNA-directed RNA polymerase subunit K/omega